MTMVATERPVLGKRYTYLYDGLYTYTVYEWDEETQAVVGVSVGTGYDGDPEAYRAAVVTATPEVVAKADAWERERQFHYTRAVAATEAMYKAGEVTKGKRVTVVKGRKVAKGTEGVVLWMGDGGYGMRVMLGLGEKDATGTYAEVVYTALGNVQPTDYDPSDYMPSEAEVRERVASVKFQV